MQTLAELQTEFINMLKSDEHRFNEYICQDGQLTNAQRAQIYKNAYSIRLIKVLEQDHETLGKYLGDDLFDDMVNQYLQMYPSRSSTLRDFGQFLPHFLRHNSPFSLHGILAEIAEFERALLAAFDAPDDPLLSFESLQKIPQSQWPNLVLQLHPSVQLMKCNYSSVESWQALKNDTNPPEPKLTSPQYWIVCREPDKRTGFHLLTQSQFDCLTCIKRSLPFSFVCETAAAALSDQDKGTLEVMQLLQQGIQCGWFRQCT